MVTVTVAFSLRGYWRTLSERMACKPAIKDDQADDHRQNGTTYEEIGNLHRLIILRPGRLLEIRSKVVVDHRPLAVAELEDPCADNHFPFLETAGNGDEIAAVFAEAHELLAKLE